MNIPGWSFLCVRFDRAVRLEKGKNKSLDTLKLTLIQKLVCVLSRHNQLAPACLDEIYINIFQQTSPINRSLL